MSVRVRLTRVGSKKNPAWRVVVADQRSARDGRIIESIGHYNPQTEPSTIVIDRERLQHWVDQGAQPTNTVRKLMRAPDTVTQAIAPEAAPASAPVAGSDEAGAEASTEEGEAGTVPAPDERGDAESPAEGADAPGGSADSDADAGPSGAAVEPAEADEAPADADAAT